MTCHSIKLMLNCWKNKCHKKNTYLVRIRFLFLWCFLPLHFLQFFWWEFFFFLGLVSFLCFFVLLSFVFLLGGCFRCDFTFRTWSFNITTWRRRRCFFLLLFLAFLRNFFPFLGLTFALFLILLLLPLTCFTFFRHDVNHKRFIYVICKQMFQTSHWQLPHWKSNHRNPFQNLCHQNLQLHGFALQPLHIPLFPCCHLAPEIGEGPANTRFQCLFLILSAHVFDWKKHIINLKVN